MRTPARRRPRYAEVTATLALIVALGGTSYAVTALPRNSVGAKQLKPDAVSSAKVRNGSLRANDFAKSQLPSGAPGAIGPKGDPGAKGDAGPPGLVRAFTGLKSSGSFAPLTDTGVDVATVNLTTGNYVLYGNVIFSNNHPTTRLMTCGLGAPGIDPGGTSLAQVDRESVELPAGVTGSISAMGAMHLGPPTTLSTTATLTCFQSGAVDAGAVDYIDADIVAIPVGQIG